MIGKRINKIKNPYPKSEPPSETYSFGKTIKRKSSNQIGKLIKEIIIVVIIRLTIIFTIS